MARSHPAVRWPVVLGVVGLLVAGTASPLASAHQALRTTAVASSISETVVLPEDNYTVYTFSLWIGETITYDIRVTDGSAIDLYFMPPDALVDYADPSAPQFRIFERTQDRTSFNGTFDVASGDIVVVLDNVDLALGGATPLGTVVVAVSMHKNPSMVYLGAVGLIGLGVALLAAAAILARRRGKRPAKAPRPPPPMPYEKRPPQGLSAEPAPPEQPPPEGPKEGS